MEHTQDNVREGFFRHSGRRRLVLLLAETILGPVDPPPGSSTFLAALDTMVGRLPETDRRLLALLFVFLNVSPILYLQGRNFGGLSQKQRDVHLHRLMTSRWGMFRRTFQVVKTLIMFSYYGTPEAWPAITYDGPWLGRVAVEHYADPLPVSRHR